MSRKGFSPTPNSLEKPTSNSHESDSRSTGEKLLQAIPIEARIVLLSHFTFGNDPLHFIGEVGSKLEIPINNLHEYDQRLEEGITQILEIADSEGQIGREDVENLLRHLKLSSPETTGVITHILRNLQETNQENTQTLQMIEREFQDKESITEQSAYQFLLRQFHPSGLQCPEGHLLGKGQRPHRLSKRGLPSYRCRECGRVYHLFTNVEVPQVNFTCVQFIEIVRGLAREEHIAELAQRLEFDRTSLYDLSNRIYTYWRTSRTI